jgi:linoleoyl-CoA desaturase
MTEIKEKEKDTKTKEKEKYIFNVNNELYDLTNFIPLHPGGTDMFNCLKPGSNITSMIYSYHKDPKNILNILPKYKTDSVTNLKLLQGDVVYTYDKYLELKKLVYDEMHEQKIPFFWSTSEIIWNAFMFVIYVSSYIFLFYNAATISAFRIFIFSMFGLGYGALVFHETSHYTGFKNQKMNLMISKSIHCPFITNSAWKFDHNYLHHNFTNTDNDCDFRRSSSNILRHGNHQELKSYNRFQFMYNILLFLFAGIALGPLRSIVKKRFNFLWVPLFLYFLGPKNTTLLYAFNGLIFAFIAQLSHIQHDCIQINTEKKNDFLYNQVSSSVNYRTENPIIRYICFGLDIQIEHHLFPNIPHSSLRRVQHIVKAYCDKNDIPYTTYPSMFYAIINYVKYMYKMGNP